jgi:hypothetical protein
MTTNPAEGVGIKSIRVSGVATHPETTKVWVFGPMNYIGKFETRVDVIARGSPRQEEGYHAWDWKKDPMKIHSMPKDENCRRLEDDDVVIIEWYGEWCMLARPCFFQKRRRGRGKDDENVRLDAFLINDVTGKIACLKSVWLPCMYDRKVDYSWRMKSGRDEKR